MDAAEFARQIAGSWAALDGLFQLGRTIISRTSLAIDTEYRDVALDPSSSYQEIYRAGLSRSFYNIILKDYSYFQFSRSGNEDWRLSYSPNPWLTGVPSAERMLQELERRQEAGELSDEQVGEFLAEFPYSGAVPPIRFEFSADQYREFSHPAAHFHIGRHTENRWPSSLAVGPLCFSMIVIKLYYPDVWCQKSSYSRGRPEGCVERQLLAILERTAQVHQFSVMERGSFHFGRHIVPAPNPPAPVARARSGRPRR